MTHLGVLNYTLQAIHDCTVFRWKSLSILSTTLTLDDRLTSQVFFNLSTVLLFKPARTANIVEKLFNIKHFCLQLVDHLNSPHTTLTSANLM